MWEISFADQTLTFLFSLLAGAALCLLYDLFRIFRLSRNTSKLGIFLEDILYFAIAGFLTFCFLIVRCSGEIRGYVLLGELLGFLICRCTLSALILCVARQIYRFLKCFFRLILKPVKAFGGFIWKKAGPLRGFIKKFPKLAGGTAKKVLKGPSSLVYNLSNRKGRKKAAAEAAAEGASR